MYKTHSPLPGFTYGLPCPSRRSSKTSPILLMQSYIVVPAMVGGRRRYPEGRACLEVLGLVNA